MPNTAKQVVTVPAQVITISDITMYLAYLKHKDGDTSAYMSRHHLNPTDELLGEPDVSDDVKSLAMAFVEGLGGIQYFMKREGVRWLFHGYSMLTVERQNDCMDFFYENKDSILALMYGIVESKAVVKGDHAYWLRGIAGTETANDEVIEAYKTIRDAATAPKQNSITLLGRMIVQLLWQGLYCIEMEYSNTYNQVTP